MYPCTLLRFILKYKSLHTHTQRHHSEWFTCSFISYKCHAPNKCKHITDEYMLEYQHIKRIKASGVCSSITFDYLIFEFYRSDLLYHFCFVFTFRDCSWFQDIYGVPIILFKLTTLNNVHFNFAISFRVKNEYAKEVLKIATIFFYTEVRIPLHYKVYSNCI